MPVARPRERAAALCDLSIPHAPQRCSIRMEFERRTPEAQVNTAAEAVAEWF
jgi:hypothetical protein